MKGWAFHAKGAVRNDGVTDPLCGTLTGFGAKGCDQALIASSKTKVTCKKCKRLLRPKKPKCFCGHLEENHTVHGICTSHRSTPGGHVSRCDCTELRLVKRR